MPLSLGGQEKKCAVIAMLFVTLKFAVILNVRFFLKSIFHIFNSTSINKDPHIHCFVKDL